MQKKYVIWSNRDLDPADWKDSYAQFLEINEISGNPEDQDEVVNYMIETNDEYLEDEKANLRTSGEPILVIANLGLWNGRKTGYAVIESGDIAKCLFSRCDYVNWYVDGADGEFRCEASHHDGTNRYLYRRFKNEVSEDAREELLEKIYENKFSQEDLDELTIPLGPEIAKIFGWELEQKGA